MLKIFEDFEQWYITMHFLRKPDSFMYQGLQFKLLHLYVKYELNVSTQKRQS